MKKEVHVTGPWILWHVAAELVDRIVGDTRRPGNGANAVRECCQERLTCFVVVAEENGFEVRHAEPPH